MNRIAPDPWLGVEPRHLATLAAVAEAGSFRAAAASLGYVQSAVSQQIAQLERALDICLVERGQGNRELRFTPEGLIVLQHAQRIVERVRAASADMGYLAGGNAPRIGVEPPATVLVPEIAGRFLGGTDRLELDVRAIAAAELPDLVIAGELDFGIGSFGAVERRLASREIHRDPWCLLVPAASPAAARARVDSLHELEDMTLIDDRSQRPPLDLRRLRPKRVIACDRFSVALELVAAGIGASLVPALCVPDGDARVVALDVGALPSRVISIIWLAGRRLPEALEHLEAPSSVPEAVILQAVA